jgi:hypothetical protein
MAGHFAHHPVRGCCRNLLGVIVSSKFNRIELRGAGAVFALLSISGVTLAQTDDLAPRPVMNAATVSVAPVLDGDVLGDPAWEGLEPTTGFWQIQPDNGQPATQRTEVFIGFDANNLYIGVVAYDEDPSGIVMTESRRDADLDDSDAFLMVIDGLLDRQNGYVFATNPAGLQHDGQVIREGAGGQVSIGQAGGYNKNWDGVWDVSAQISDIGWSAEYQIPFTTLRFGNADPQVWGINFQRNIRRNNEITFWAQLERNRNLYRVSEAGTLHGVAPPAQRNLKIAPYGLSRTEEGGDLTGRESDTEFGVDVKYSITPSLTLDLTYNTDFAQVEADEVQINLDRFNLFFAEKRPFFLENAGQFTVGNPREVELFFSRRIGIGDGGRQIPVEGGARLSGKIGGTTNVGLLYMGTEEIDGFEAGNKFGVVRINQELANRSSVGVVYTSREGDGSLSADPVDDKGTTLGFDGRWGIGDNLMLRGWVAKTDTPTLNGKEDAYSVHADYDSASWAYRLNYTEVGGDFNPEVGFLSRRDYKKRNAFLMYRYRPENLWGLLELRPHISITDYHDFNGFKESGFIHLDNHWDYRNGWLMETGVNLTYEGVKDPFEIVPGVIIPADNYDHARAHFVVHSNQAEPLSFNLRTAYGGAWGGDQTSLAPSVRYRYGETFSAELSYSYNKFALPYPNGNFNANLSVLRLQYSFTPSILLQALVQYNEVSDKVGTNLRFSWLQSASSGLYLVYNEIDERGIGARPKGKEFIIKYSYIFDVFN